MEVIWKFFCLVPLKTINTALLLIERMIQFNEEISFLVTFIYGAIDDLYQEIMHFSKSKIILHMLY